MALLQISEPGGKVEKPAHRIAIGIDLGTTNSLVAASCAGKVEILPNANGELLLPSVVHYGKDGAIIVGAAAKQQAVTDAANTISSVKRWLGRSGEEVSQSPENAQYTFATQDASAPVVTTAQGNKNPVQVSADILRSLLARAEACLKGQVEGAVITVPAYFNDAQRTQTREAAQLAGIKVLRLLNEPTAAAVAYGLDTSDEGNVVVFDLGGGTFDVSLLSLRRGIFEVLATGGDTHLGGDDFDAALLDHLLSLPGIDGRANRVQLRHYAGELKHRLSDQESVPIEFGDCTAELTRDKFAELVQPLVNRTITACRRVLRDAAMEVTAIDNVVLVGGATRMPVIRDAVSEFFGKPPLTAIDPDKAVAVGAGLQADVLIGNKSADDFLLLDVNPLSLGIETMGELVEKIIPRNTTIPVAKAQEFTTFKDGQTAMSLHVVQGERELVSACRSLARFELRGIPPMVAGAAKIRVTFQVDADGLLSVLAEETSTGNKAEVQVKPSYGLQADTIEEMLQASHDQAVQDRDIRALQEAKIEAQQIINAIHSAMAADGSLLASGERQAIAEAISSLEAAVATDDARQIHELTTELNRLSGDFAARRMDLHIGALQGESIDAIDAAVAADAADTDDVVGGNVAG